MGRVSRWTFGDSLVERSISIGGAVVQGMTVVFGEVFGERILGPSFGC